jgi:hypothetical protein
VRILVDIVENELKALDKMAKSEKVSLRSSAKLSTIFWIVMIRQKRQKLSGSGVIERSMGSNTRISSKLSTPYRKPATSLTAMDAVPSASSLGWRR